VRGLSGAQFALPEAVEMLRSVASSEGAAPVVLTASDPANVFTLPMPQDPSRDPFVRARGRGSLLVTMDGVAVMIAERRGARVTVRPDTADSVATRAAQALASHLAARTSRDVIVETIDGQPASGSRYADAFRAAGFRRGTTGLRFYQGL
jgi:ATP-dependent helicase Lhr and Lhr-like helicase